MSYFSKLKTIIYSFEKSKNFSLNEITDITKRGKIVQFFQNNRIFDINYRNIEDGEKPETIAYKEYDDPNLHWVILLLNEIKNPLFEWPKTSINLNEFIEEKYRGTSIFLNVFLDTEVSDSCRCEKNSFPIQDYLLKKGQTVVLKSVSGEEYEGEILDFYPEIGELVVDFTTNNFSEEENTANTSDYISILLNTETIEGTNTSIDIKPFSIKIYTKRKYSIHHFEKNNNNADFLLPLEDFVNDSYLEPSNLNDIYNGSTSFFNSTDFCFSQTLLGTFLGCNSNGDTIESDYVITNQEYEFSENEKRRTILLPKKETIDEIVKQLNLLLK